MKETRSERFKRLAEARVNKLIAMVRLLGNLSNPVIYEYRPDQVARIFSALQTELNRARNRFYQREGRRNRFSLSEPSPEPLPEEHSFEKKPPSFFSGEDIVIIKFSIELNGVFSNFLHSNVGGHSIP